MNSRTAKGYLFTIGFGFILLAAFLLLVLQWGNVAQFSLYGKNTDVGTFWVVLISLIAGPILMYVIKYFYEGVMILYRARREEARLLKTAHKAEVDQGGESKSGKSSSQKSR